MKPTVARESRKCRERNAGEWHCGFFYVLRLEWDTTRFCQGLYVTTQLAGGFPGGGDHRPPLQFSKLTHGHKYH
jgi:hypothetical protein